MSVELHNNMRCAAAAAAALPCLQVPDAASGRSYLSSRQLSLRGRDRDREGGAARLLSHPLLHPQCRKDMTRAATRCAVCVVGYP